MTLDAAAQMRRSPSLKQRIESAAYAQGQSMQWVDRNIAAICATPEWATVWSQAWADETADGIQNPDVGSRRSIVTDDMIEAAVEDVVKKTTEAADADATALAALQAQMQQQAAQIADLQAALAQQAPAGS